MKSFRKIFFEEILFVACKDVENKQSFRFGVNTANFFKKILKKNGFSKKNHLIWLNIHDTMVSCLRVISYAILLLQIIEQFPKILQFQSLLKFHTPVRDIFKPQFLKRSKLK